MDASQLKGLTYIKCRNPTRIVKNGNVSYYRCGACDLCLQARIDRDTLLLRLEERNNIFSYFTTLTYDDNNLPTYVLEDCLPIKFVEKGDARGYFYSQKYDTIRLIPTFVRPSSVLGTSSFTDEYASDCGYEDIVVKDVSYLEVSNYYKHLFRYEKKYCHTSFKTNVGSISLCPKRDLQLFIQRLKNYCRRKLGGAKFTYYAVPDYGTNGLRPHWHILFFFSSYRLYEEFEKCKNYGTASKPSYSSILIHSLWQYGITNTSRVRKSCASYVSSYLNSVGSFPTFLRKCQKIRSYHSPNLGQVCSQETIRQEFFCNKNFGFFETLVGSNYDGTSFTYGMPSGFYSRLLPRYPYLDPKDCYAFRQVYNYLVRFCDGSMPLKSIALSLYHNIQSFEPPFMRDYRTFAQYSYIRGDCSLFYRLLLVTNGIKRLLTVYNISLDEYIDVLFAYRDYKSRQSLRNFMIMLSNDSFAAAYYMSLNTDFKIPNIYMTDYLDTYNERLSDNIKHKNIAELYRFN